MSSDCRPITGCRQSPNSDAPGRRCRTRDRPRSPQDGRSRDGGGARAGPHVAPVVPPYIYVHARTRALSRRPRRPARPVIDAVSKMPGILRVIPARGLDSRSGPAPTRWNARPRSATSRAESGDARATRSSRNGSTATPRRPRTARCMPTISACRWSCGAHRSRPAVTRRGLPG